jgi:hypothetical protein
MRFAFPHSHAFRGGRVVVDETDEPTGSDCLVEFGDGVSVVGRWRRLGDTIDLRIPSHRTAKGTTMEARSWRLKPGDDGTWRSTPPAADVGER